MRQQAICRSYLFVPAQRMERVRKAQATRTHAVIVDFEDAVPPDEKAAARDAAVRVLPGLPPVLIRVNAAETEWFEEDIAACAAIGVAGIVVAKAETSEALQYGASRLPAHAVILPLVESARGYAAAGELCAVPGVQRLVFGSIDFQLDLGISGEGEELLHFRSGLVLASRLSGVQPPVDGVTVEIHDEGQIRSDTLRGRRLGFGGKLCIHPKQVDVVNACFQPTATEVEWARRVVQAADAARGGAVQLDGRMVDRPVIVKAQEILAAVDAA